MKNYFCSDNPLVRGCAVLEKFETNNPDQTEINEDACDDFARPVQLYSRSCCTSVLFSHERE